MKHSNTNMPCDTYGMLACSTSCSRYYECFKPVAAEVKPTEFSLDETDLQELIDSLEYSIEQVENSAGEVCVFGRDLESNPEQQLLMANDAFRLKTHLKVILLVASKGKVTIEI